MRFWKSSIITNAKSSSLKINQRLLRSHASTNKIITVIPGDGIGRDLCDSTLGVLQAADAAVSFEIFDTPKYPDIFASDIVSSISRNEVALKGPLVTKKGEDSRNQRLRKLFALFANIVPLKSIEYINTRHKNIDIVVVRENIEGEYTRMESEIVPGVVQSLKVTTANLSKQIAEQAFQYATQYNRKKVTAVHKANIMKLTDGLFLEQRRLVAKEYPSIQYNEIIIDNACMQLVMNPSQFDVMVTPNLYGNIVINVITGLIGGPGLVPGCNVGNRIAIFEPGARHGGHNIQGNQANPTGMILSAIAMLRFLKDEEHAAKIENALLRVYKEGKVRTTDIGGTCTTREFTHALIQNL